MSNDRHVKATIKRLEYKSALYRCRAMGLKFPGTEIYEFISLEAYNDWLNREDDDGLMKYDGKFDPTHPFVVTTRQAGSRKICVDIIGLYIHLWENRDEDCVVLLDDVDVFSNEDTLNVLKAALDTGEERIITWGTASNYLAERDIPNNFEFKGSIVFITNAEIDAEIDRGTKLAPHLDALQSRSIYLDLGVHTSREIMVRVEDVITKTDMLQKRGLSEAQVVNALEWMKENVDRLRSVSLRTALYLGDFINTDSDWADVAEVTLLK